MQTDSEGKRQNLGSPRTQNGFIGVFSSVTPRLPVEIYFAHKVSFRTVSFSIKSVLTR